MVIATDADCVWIRVKFTVWIGSVIMPSLTDSSDPDAKSDTDGINMAELVVCIDLKAPSASVAGVAEGTTVAE